MKTIMSGLLTVCLLAIPSISSAEKMTEEMAAVKVRLFLGLQPGVRYVYKGTLNHPAYLVKTKENSIDIDKGPMTTVEATISIGPTEDGSYVTRGLDISKSLVIETESDPIIRYQRVDSDRNVVAESTAPLQSSFTVAIPRTKKSLKETDLEENEKMLKITQTDEKVSVLIFTKNADGTIDIESSSRVRPWDNWGPKVRDANQHNDNFKIVNVAPISPR